MKRTGAKRAGPRFTLRRDAATLASMRIPQSASPRRAVALLCVAAACGLLSACSAASPLPEEDLFREASLALEDESYATAIADYKKMLEEYPFSDKAEIASLNIAFAHYLTGEYAAAIGSFNDFERNYPVSPLLPFVGYTIGMCWLDQAKDGQRDASASDEALRQFQKVANEFPRTLYADLARYRQSQARENLANHEISIGDYYRDRKQYDAAGNRYRYAVEKYPTTEAAVRANGKLQKLQELASAGVKQPSTIPGQGDSDRPSSGSVETPASTASAPSIGTSGPMTGGPGSGPDGL